MRFLPNHLRVDIRERVPVAFVRMGSSPELIDASGVVMNMPATKGDWSFPVITGMLDSEPLSTRAPRMKRYMELMAEFESDGYSKDLEEVDLSDPEDLKISVSDSGSIILIHLGTSSFLDNYKLFKSHLQEWRQQYSNLKEVDLRYSGQVILNPGSGAENTGIVSKPPAASTVKRVRHRR
jgi:cell division protein FtsQ